MQYTTNYNLKKPLQTEFYNVDDFNDNADTLDAALKTVADAAAQARNYYRLVAASDSPKRYKDAANYVCDGTDDNVEINNAASVDSVGVTILLAPGTYNLSGLTLKYPKSNILFEGIGEVHFVLSSLIDIAAENTRFRNICFEHTQNYGSDSFIRINGIEGHQGDGVTVEECIFDLSAEGDHVFASGVAIQRPKGVFRLTDCTLLCAYSEYDLIKPEIGVWASCIVTGCAAMPPLFNGTANIIVDENDFSNYNKFALAGNINFTLVERT